ncbi:YesL family protein [Halanaerobium sp. ST460_2HS_T2]|uniref:YesL family protein n=1 Tax=Halanaerobium sp. ST460_2HS_T2 TaxID=2183914 RepID=UPI000DF3E723|nr:DUF624 domain-containing protein [Halanaerobium sp. ST460_2HS_T2]RCW62483.1 putative membrane protein YesL [Halanaerobium sp. ST460_2HS_T2]
MENKYLSYDGVFFNIFKMIYKLLLLNIIWLFFSIPLITIGASTTALFYLSGKIVRKENINSIFSSFWKSFKLNFKNSTIIWIILLTVSYFIFVNMININLMPGLIAKYIYIIQLIALFEIFITTMYIFPLLSRYHVTIINAFKASFFIANRHFLTTIKCLIFFPIFYLIFSLNSFFVLFIVVFYALWISYILKDRFVKYAQVSDEDER